MIIVGIASCYLLGSVITAIILGYLDYEEDSDKPPIAVLILVWPLTLLIFCYLKLYGLGRYFKNARDLRIANKQRKLAETTETNPRPRWLGPSPK